MFANPKVLFANPKVLFANPKVLFANQKVLFANPKVLLANQKVLLANPKALRAVEPNLVGGTYAERCKTSLLARLDRSDSLATSPVSNERGSSIQCCIVAK